MQEGKQRALTSRLTTTVGSSTFTGWNLDEKQANHVRSVGACRGYNDEIDDLPSGKGWVFLDRL